jgi:hypothetical protein
MGVFISLGSPLLSASAVKRLASYVARHPEKATEHISSVAGAYDGLCHYWPALAVIAPEILELKYRFLVPVQPFFSYIKASTHLAPHRDGAAGGRKTSIIQPIFPLDAYCPLRFWTEHGELLCELQPADYPAIVDLQSLHSVDNTHSGPRFNFQLSIDRSFDEVQALHQAGKLLRPAPTCS